MDFDLILTALDERTRTAIKEALAPLQLRIKELEGELEKADQAIAETVIDVHSKWKDLQNQREADWSGVEQRTAALAQRIDVVEESTQKQVREAIARAPVPTYKGVYDKDAEYQVGDMVTQDGSVWHCNAAVAGEKPGGNEFWTLAVKRGRDGKDATKDAE